MTQSDDKSRVTNRNLENNSQHKNPTKTSIKLRVQTKVRTVSWSFQLSSCWYYHTVYSCICYKTQSCDHVLGYIYQVLTWLWNKCSKRSGGQVVAYRSANRVVGCVRISVKEMNWIQLHCDQRIQELTFWNCPLCRHCTLFKYSSS